MRETAAPSNPAANQLISSFREPPSTGRGGRETRMDGESERPKSLGAEAAG